MSEEPGGALTSGPTLGNSLDAGARERMTEAFRATPLHELLGLDVHEVGPAGVRVRMPVRESAFNSTGNLHGGSLATLIDVAAGTAAAAGSSFQAGVNTIVTVDLHVRYLGRPHGSWVEAEAKVVKAGRQLVVVECEVRDGEDRLVAAADFSSMIVPLRMPLFPSERAKTSDPDL